jgi:hypothetical protein
MSTEPPKEDLITAYMRPCSYCSSFSQNGFADGTTILIEGPDGEPMEVLISAFPRKETFYPTKYGNFTQEPDERGFHVPFICPKCGKK